MIFSLVLPLFSSNAFAVQADPPHKEVASLRPDTGPRIFGDMQKRTKPSEKNKPGCSVMGNEIEFSSRTGVKKTRIDLLAGERIIDSACIRDRAFILTDKRLLATTSVEGGGDGIQAFTAWFDISDANKKGIVAWTQAYDTCYLLTKDGKVAPIFVDDNSKNRERTVYLIPFPVDNAKIVEFAGVLFVAVDGENLMAFTFSGKSDSRYLPIGADPSSGFKTKDDRLFYGKDGGKVVEIKVKKGIQTLKDLEFSGL
jgi:hypothetical protein